MQKELELAAHYLDQGKAIVFPTETVYGLAARIDRPEAIASIFEIKGRPEFHPLIVHIDSAESLAPWVDEIPKQAEILMKKFWPGALTLVFKKSKAVPSLVTGGQETVAIRCPAHPLAQRLLEKVGVPLAAPSANRFGELSPTRVTHAQKQLGDRVAFYLDGGPCELGLESTILSLVDGPKLLRLGSIEKEKLEEVLGEIPHQTKHQMPGGLEYHYSPRKNIYWESDAPKSKNAALITLKATAEDRKNYTEVYELSETGSLTEAAFRFFDTLHKADQSDCSHLVAKPFPKTGLGLAMQDRLDRATKRSEIF